MEIWEELLLSVALAMDCFTVSIVSGIILRKWVVRPLLRMALLFGFFQALMPLLGCVSIYSFSGYVEPFDHWIAFAMLSVIGLKMLKDAFSKEEKKQFNPLKLKNQVALAFATSIDALAIGVSLACLGYTSLPKLTQPVVIIGIGSFVFTILGCWLGIRLGEFINKIVKPELLGGLILIGIGFKILISHLIEI